MFEFITDHVFDALLWIFVGSGIIQFSPLKFNPWTYIAQRIAVILNKDVIDKVDKIEKDVTKLREEMSITHATDIRIRILNFNEELRLDHNPSKDSFNQILEDIDNYEAYCSAHPDYKNNRGGLAIKNIKAEYEKRLKEHDFT